MLKINKKLRVMCAAAALMLLAFPVGCGSADNSDNDAGNGVNSDGIYDGSPENNGGNTILDDAENNIQNGANSIMNDLNGVDNGMTNNSTTSTTGQQRMATSVNRR